MPAQTPESPETTAATFIPRPLAHDLHWCAVRLARGLGSVEEQVVREHGLGLRGYVVLTAIAEQPMASQLEISRLGAFDKSVLVGFIDELERAGFVARMPDPRDRRARLLSMTPEGQQALATATEAIRGIEDALLAGLPAEQRQAFVAALRQVGSSDFAATFNTEACE